MHRKFKTKVKFTVTSEVDVFTFRSQDKQHNYSKLKLQT